MGDVKGRDPELKLDAANLRAELNPNFRVQGRQRFVEQEDARLDGERPRERNPLLLAS